jgi:hypothetical protein
MVTVTLSKTVAPTDTSSVTDRSAGSASAGDAIVGYRAFVAVVVAAYRTAPSEGFTLSVELPA